MADSEGQYGFPDDGADDDQSIISTRGLEAFSRKVTTTASHLMGPQSTDPSANPYHSAMSEVHKQLKRPGVQRSVFSVARTTPTDLVRSKLSTTEIQHRALTYLPDELLTNIPDHQNSYSLFQGFKATFPELTDEGKKHRRRASRGRKLMLEDAQSAPGSIKRLQQLKKDKAAMLHEFQLFGIRKSMASSEIREIDNKIANLHGMRRIILDRLASLEQEEALLEHESKYRHFKPHVMQDFMLTSFVVVEIEGRLEEAQVLADEAEEIARNMATQDEKDLVIDAEDHEFMSQSVYEKIPGSSDNGPRKAKKVHRKISMPILHEHFEAGSNIREIRAHQDSITALDFDAPFGTMATAALDDTVRVWDLNAGRCMGHLQGHTASVRALQIEDNILATGSMDATIKLWDLSRSRYDPHGGLGKDDAEEDAIAWENPDDQPVDPPEGSMDNCELYTLRAHVDEITALHFRGDVMVSGSADKTIRHWDLEKGRCVQTLDVMWAAAQASATIGSGDNTWRPTGRSSTRSADFVGALQVFETALACGTADGMVRLWDLRSGQVHRSLVGHTAAVTCLQFDDVHLVTGSLDRSIRIWDLRTGSIYDAYAYDNPITDMMFDTRRIVSAAGEDVVKVYDKVEGRQWDCGAGITAAEEGKQPSIVERVRVKDGYLVEGRQDGIVAPAGQVAGAHGRDLESQAEFADFAEGEATRQLLTRQARLIAQAHRALQSQCGAGSNGTGNLKLVAKRLDDVSSISMSKFYSYRYDQVPEFWRHIYTEALVLKTHYHLLVSVSKKSGVSEETFDLMVETLDRALITTGGHGKYLTPKWIEDTISCLDLLWREGQKTTEGYSTKQTENDTGKSEFPLTEPYGRPVLRKDRECPRHPGWTLEQFENRINSGDDPQPMVFPNLICDWPALQDCPWKSRDYLLSKTLGGRRLVPVEVGRSYVDDGWGQELIPFRDFLSKYIAPHEAETGEGNTQPIGYLAQHDLLRQIPALRNDLLVPDFCWSDAPKHPSDPAMDHPTLDTPQLNAWFGPAKTITPLHTDGYHNILCQAVGTKYLRLYPPPRPPEHGVNMSNTSALDVGVLEGWDPLPEGMDERMLEEVREELRGVEYTECILGPGDALYIPIGWWHYVRSLSVSFSVSFWWN
ncbi:unnamed protein product [Clonostachys rosea f. rosea IK726]|uniref:Uncharacterized protein n=1 Tax=Clonostachys rosea f. rosea IK726 TaxID=1349383 RepID=A0ACA9T8P0_BIOOC|nr:unnamed protein product [Clonostachys rosea f. rosea IK726]